MKILAPKPQFRILRSQKPVQGTVHPHLLMKAALVGERLFSNVPLAEVSSMLIATPNKNGASLGLKVGDSDIPFALIEHNAGQVTVKKDILADFLGIKKFFWKEVIGTFVKRVKRAERQNVLVHNLPLSEKGKGFTEKTSKELFELLSHQDKHIAFNAYIVLAQRLQAINI